MTVAAGDQREVERKFELDRDAPFPDLRAIPEVARVGEPVEIDLSATYYDTRALALASHGISLRRRTGGHDAGWHLKLPAGGDERTEVRMPLAVAEEVALDALLDRVRAYVRDQEVAAVALVQTIRLERHLYDDEGTDLAVVADDVVRAQHFTEHGVDLTGWRELEVELVDGRPRLLRAATEVLERAGVRRARAGSKVQHALGIAPPSTAEPLGPRPTVGAVLARHLRQQVDALLAVDPAVRVDQPDAVHTMRVATRRLRSALATFRPILDRTETDPIRAELRWLGALLGEPRDAEVLRARLDALVDEQPGDLVMGPVRARIGLELRAEHQRSHRALVEALDGPRYFALLDRLEALAVDPPFGPDAGRRADRALPGLVRHACRRVDRSAADVDGAQSDADRDLRLHAVRKAAKRARYAAESAEPVIGKPARRTAKRMEAVQEALGEHQDAVTASRRLRDIGVAAHLSGESAFTFGLLHGLEQGRADDAEAQGWPALEAASAPSVRRWLRG